MQIQCNQIAWRVPFMLFLLTVSAAAHAQYTYDIIPLSLPGQPFLANGLNNEGQIAGDTPDYALNVYHAAYYSNGQIHDVTPTSTTTTDTPGINDNGMMPINSYSNLAVYNINTQATQATGLGGQNVLIFEAINGKGDVVYINGGYTGVYHYDTNSFENFSVSGVSSLYYAINNEGQLAGVVNQVAAYYSDGAYHTIGALPGSFLSTARGINDNGDICGQSDYQTGPAQHAFLYHNGQIQDLGILQPNTSSAAYSINNAGTVVGGSGSLPFVYQNGKMQNLFSLTDPSLGFTSGVARAINNNGWIIGDSNQGSFLAIPHAAATPAPGSLLTFGAGIGALLLAARFRKRRVPA